VGKNVHLSGGVGLGGVLEPLQANPTIIEDNCFIGARSEVVEGVIVEENSVISMGVYIGQSTPIYDRATGEITYGRVPAGSVVVSGNLPKEGGATACTPPSSSSAWTPRPAPRPASTTCCATERSRQRPTTTTTRGSMSTMERILRLMAEKRPRTSTCRPMRRR
jgi:carbonic anhydrase/acetyltransferase-like protein (isoleucine patch superfamily)